MCAKKINQILESDTTVVLPVAETSVVKAGYYPAERCMSCGTNTNDHYAYCGF